MKNSFSDYYIEEWIIDGDLDDIQGSLATGKVLLNTRVFQSAYKRSMEIGKIYVEDNFPSFLMSQKIKRLCKIHLLLCVNNSTYTSHSYKNLKTILLKLVKNKSFLTDKNFFIEKHSIELIKDWPSYIDRINKKIDDEDYKPFLVTARNYLEIYELMKKYRISREFYSLFKDLLIMEEDFISSEYEEIIFSNIDHTTVFNSFVYLIRDIEENNLVLNCEMYGTTTLADIKNNFICIRYFQEKYYRNILRKSNVKNIDNYLRLYQLDKRGSLVDWEKADEIFKLNESTLPSPTEDEKRRNRIKTMRKRLNKI